MDTLRDTTPLDSRTLIGKLGHTDKVNFILKSLLYPKSYRPVQGRLHETKNGEYIFTATENIIPNADLSGMEYRIILM